ncbi:hypothetical protein AGABI2DRAFT_192067 [Agaricus bisporus var. bisporus H97]|uniref:hypothetical protein n=1 Tax=Agaricus bisporus var. bisporus (strain H97 / ATCC MYA-4626 / FGSC 10389) TaxID=936046 RepID=UPI00029F7475|nr:hypothetical protein AGABI2DRAFT_192067 [Agaricus bisporus var. bisporus H97]EKV48465.1 hypothetical protein AGABI2DRAFT_192067 [Agaricus bisporus var. bisporus H97]
MSDTVFSVDAILFDMDGTLVDSTAGVVGAWDIFHESYPDIDVKKILSTSHGIRTVDNLRNHCRVEDPTLLESEALRFEEAIVTSSTNNGRPGIVKIKGLEQILPDIEPFRHLPSPRWSICTSATRKYALAALKAAGVPVPDVLVAAEDVVAGKPQPDPYLLGAKLCGVDPTQCVVFEDAPAGVQSGRAAGCKTIGLLTTHSREQMEAAQPDILVQDLTSITVRVKQSKGLEIIIRKA